MAKKKILKLAEETKPTSEGVQEVTNTGTRMNRQQFGNSGTEIYGGQFSEEYLGELVGERGADAWDKIRRSESQVAMLLGAIYNPIKAADWEVRPAIEGDEISKQHKELVEHILFEKLPRGFKAFVHEALSFIPFGFSIFEVVHNVNFNHPKFGTFNGLASLGFRQQKSISRWNLEKKTGNLLSVEQQESGDVAENATIPGQFLLVFSNNREGDNYEGISALRPMYGAWKRKHLFLKLTAIGVEKYAYGIVTGEVPAGKEKSPEFEAFQEHLRAYMANEKGYLLRPAGWNIEIIKEAFDADKLVELLRFENTEMINALVANFLALGTGGNGGAYALGKDLSDFFLNGIQSYADMIVEEINRQLIPNLVQLNFGEQASYPKLAVSGINDKAGKELAEVLSSLIGSKAIMPDMRLEEFLRKSYNLPKPDVTTARKSEPPKPMFPSQGGPPPFPPQLKEKSATFQMAENSKKYRKQWEENKVAVKEVMQKGLRQLADNMLKSLERNYDKASDSNYIKAANDLNYAGKNDYLNALKEMFAAISVEAVNTAKSELPKSVATKLREDVRTLKLADIDKLPPFLKNLLAATAASMETQIGDLEKIVKFQFMASAPSTEDFDIIKKDINQKVDAFVEGSTASGASIDAAAGNAVSHITQQSRNEVFFADDVLPEIESFTFTNEDPVSEICQDLAGTTFRADDPEAERYFPPLHHNCKSRLVPNLRGDKNPAIDRTGLKPSKASLEKFITLQENEVYASIKLGGPGSGCQGPNCGRPKGSGSPEPVKTGRQIKQYGPERMSPHERTNNLRTGAFSKNTDSKILLNKKGAEINHVDAGVFERFSRKELSTNVQPKMKSFVAQLKAEGIEVISDSARAKTFDSIQKKMNGKWADKTLDQLSDGIGMRVVVPDQATADRVAIKMERLWGKPLEHENKTGESKTGYNAHHFIVRTPGGYMAEMQIKTARQNEFAHWSHKQIYKPTGRHAAALKGDKAAADYARAVGARLQKMDLGMDPGPEPKPPTNVLAAGADFKWKKDT